MRLSATLALRAAAVGVTLGAVVVPVSLAHATVPHGTAAASPTVTVNPDTNVKNNSTVKVSGTNFPASKTPLYVIECSGTKSQTNCDTGTLNFSGSTDSSGSFSDVKVKVHTGTVGDGTCKAGGKCYIAASTSTTPSKSTSGFAKFTFAKAATVATKTAAKFSTTLDKIVGTVKAGGKGVSGLKAKLEIRSHGKWKKVATLKTHKHGAFTSKKITKNGKYEVATPKQKSYGASKSKVVKVKT